MRFESCSASLLGVVEEILEATVIGGASETKSVILEYDSRCDQPINMIDNADH